MSCYIHTTAVLTFHYSSERGNLALCQHFSENITQHCCDSYKNTCAQRINSGFQSVLSMINRIVWTIFCWQDRKIWYEIICVSSTIHANILHSWYAKNRNVTVKTIFCFWGGFIKYMTLLPKEVFLVLWSVCRSAHPVWRGRQVCRCRKLRYVLLWTRAAEKHLLAP